MYDQYAYYHYETVEEKPVPKPPVLVSFSEERAAKQRRQEKGVFDNNLQSDEHFYDFQGCLPFFPQASTKEAAPDLLNIDPFQLGPSYLLARQ